MTTYTAEFRRRGECGTMIAMSNSIEKLFKTMKERGWSANSIDLDKCLLWDTNAKEGDRYHGWNNDLRITKGGTKMTEGTSL